MTALSGCLGGNGGGGDGGNSTGGDGNSGNVPEILFWIGSADPESPGGKFRDWYHSSFEENHDAKLTISTFSYMDRRQKFLTGGRQGEPDYIEGVLSHISEFQKAGLLEPLTEQAKNLDYWDGFIEGAKDAVTYDGEVWGLPSTGNGRALVYRNDVFEELGLEPPETVEEFHQAGRTINEEMDDMWAFHNCTKEGSVRAFQEWISHVYQHEDNLYQVKDGSWELVPSAETLGTIFKNWYAEVYASDDPVGNPDSLGTGWQVNDYGYLNGDYAMIECGPWVLEMVSDDEIDDSDAAKKRIQENTTIKHLPHAENASRGTYLEVKSLMVNKHSSNTEMAFQAAEHRTNLEAFEKMKENGMNLATPMHTEISTTIENDNLAAFGDVIETARPLAKIKWGSVRTAFYEEMQAVAYGDKDPMTAGEDFHQKLDDITSDLST
ncbi:sugar ABC transporter substrate-binding protein [Halomicrobium urmianum]|uniref:sugar ABC transporter substrate-binding protein n=1 Tax=Halomicrobium urmianum TaxID=1586233 RepID=UPI001CD94205|nr:extracellular solute-binding protein [Halomicrobium urmianum]